MSSLWTPGGEHKVPRNEDSTLDRPPDGRYLADDEEELDEATAAELQELTRQLAAAPPEDVIANHCYGLFELAAVHLAQQPPNLQAARLPIDAMGLLVDGLAERLGQHRSTLAEGLNQLRMAYVRIADATSPAEPDSGPAEAPAAAPVAADPDGPDADGADAGDLDQADADTPDEADSADDPESPGAA